MATALLVIHILIALGLIISVLLQRSEGGALGIGGGGGMMSGRGSANTLTRVTAVLAGCFFLTSIGLTILARTANETGSKIDSIEIQRPADKSDTGGADKKTDTPAEKAPDAKSETPAEPVIPAP